MSRAETALGHRSDPDAPSDEPATDDQLWADRWHQGGTILDEPEICPALWGQGDQVLWAEGEGLMISAPQGTGKTTIGQQIVLHGLGVRTGPFLGQPVRKMEKVVYLAMDRPRQARRSFKRMVEDSDRDALNERLALWQGPTPADILKRPELLMLMAQSQDADVIVIDSLKDVAPGLSSDEVGAAVNSAFQHVIAAGIDLLVLHHTRKGSKDSSASGINGVYGSTWLTSGMGSIVSIAGDPGATVVKLTHTKQPADTVGPLTLQHEHRRGVTSIDPESDPLAILIKHKSLTTRQFAGLWLGVENPDRSQKERSRRVLEKLCKDGRASRTEDELGNTYSAVESAPDV